MGISHRSSWSSDGQVWVTVLWSGSRAGDRSLVMPNEEAVAVLPTVTFESSEDTFCNWTSEIYQAGRKVPIEIGYNMTVSILFSFNGSERVYNVYTFGNPDDYLPEDVTVSVAEFWEFAQEVAVVCAGFGVLAGIAAIKVRSSTA